MAMIALKKNGIKRSFTSVSSSKKAMASDGKENP